MVNKKSMFLHFFNSILIISIGLAVLSFPISAVESSIQVWPKPRTFSWPQPQATLLSSTFTISAPNQTHIHLSSAIKRYLNLIQTENHIPLVPPILNFTTSTPPLQTLLVFVSDLTAPLHHNVNESYTLTIPTRGPANLTAETVWGAMRGLETFSQLVWGDPLRVAVGLYIWDAPLFGHRGVMLDTSRNYYPVEDILRTIGAVSVNKMNPDLAAKGSYGPDMLIIPEIDSPAHTGSWAEAYPDIVTCANMFWWPAGILKRVISDVATLFPEPFYHAGADEIVPGCWKADPAIPSFLSNGGTLSQLLEIFVNSTFPYIVSLNRTVVYWEDVILDGNIKVPTTALPPEHTILQTWNNGHENTKKIVSSGYQVIVSSSDFYYLDCGHSDFLGNDSQYDQQTSDNSGNGGSWCGPFKTWQTIYNYDITYGLSEEEANLVLGGEVALWSEQADPAVLDARIWPRTSAMAETLWSGNRDETGKKRYAEATDRLNEWRCRMVRRGIGAEPIQPLWCIRNPGMCNTVQPFA
ncbi:hypothetical protein ACB092_11G266700 [Castanea dentata]